jgi:hypothetical protein
MRHRPNSTRGAHPCGRFVPPSDRIAVLRLDLQGLADLRPHIVAAAHTAVGAGAIGLFNALLAHHRLRLRDRHEPEHSTVGRRDRRTARREDNTARRAHRSRRAFSEHARLTLQTLERGITSTVRIARESEKVVVFGFTSAGMYGRLPMLIRHIRRQEKDTRLVFREYTTDALVATLRGGHAGLGAKSVSNQQLSLLRIAVLSLPQSSGAQSLHRELPFGFLGHSFS